MIEEIKETRYRRLGRGIRALFILLSLFGVGVSVFTIFNFSFFGKVLVETGYFFLLIAIYLPLLFLSFPFKKGERGMPFIDYVLSVLSFGIPFYFFLNAVKIIYFGWDVHPPLLAKILGFVLLLIILEGARRTGGWVFGGICAFLGFYPLFASHMPGPFEGATFSFWRTIGFHIMGSESILGIPMRVVGRLLIGFMVFAVALQATGGGRFFLNLALSLLGWARGGAAKVSVVASAFFGSLSGSVISNVLTTGAITIPTMKRTGYPPHYAGAIEACASTGGVLMPPVMGATAFVMAQFLGVPYAKVMIAAFLPSVLYYLCLFMQADAFAARTGLKGLPREELPSLKEVLKEGWFYLFSLLFLVWALVFMKWEAKAPFYATGILVALSMLRKETRLDLKKLMEFLEGTGRVLAELVGILCAVGLIIGSLSMTGVAHSFSMEIIELAGGSVPLLLILGAFTSFILGMGMTITACYVFLALVLAPALVKAGLFPMAVHLFIMYCGMISYITPPVALGAYAASGLAGSNPMRTGFQAMRLGAAIYFLPFFFVINPALILHGSPLEIIHAFFTCAMGITLLAGGIEGYIPGIGVISNKLKPLFAIAGILLGIPEWRTDVIGGVLLLLLLGVKGLVRVYRR